MAVTDLYNAAFMDHVSNPDYKYEMDSPTCTHEGVNPTCGRAHLLHRLLTTAPSGGGVHRPRLPSARPRPTS